MSKLSKREKILINIAAIVVLGYLYYSLVLSSVIVDVKNSFLKTRGYKQSIKNENDKNEVIAKLKVDKEAIKSDYLNAIVALPSIEKNPEIVNRVKKLALKNGIEISAVTISVPEAIIAEGQKTVENSSAGGTGNLMKIAVQINLRMSDYAKAKAFLTDLENEKRFAEITSINVRIEEGTIVQAVGANYYYVDSGSDETPNYDFNITPGGKTDIFK